MPTRQAGSAAVVEGPASSGGGTLRVHAIQTGRLVGNETVIRDVRWRSQLRPRRPYEYPVLSFFVEHPEGLIAIDTGLSTRLRVPRWQRALSIPSPLIEPGEEIDAGMRAAGLRPADVRRVVLTHLHPDHAGGLEHFPDAEVLVHRPEHEHLSNPLSRLLCQPKLWPDWFEPTLYDLDPEPYGPFPQSRALTESGDVRLVPIPGHTVGQVGVIVELDGQALFFAADHILRQDWFLEDYAKGNLLGVAFHPKLAPETSRRIHRFVEECPTVLLPSHDAGAPARLAAMEPLLL